MISNPDRQPTALTRTQAFEWRANAGRWRWLILSALGVAPNACGGQAQPTETDSNGVNLSNHGGTSGGGRPVVLPSAGGATTNPPGPVTIDPGEPVTPPRPASACENPSPVGGNWLRCDNGMLHRAARGECLSSVPRPEPVTIPAEYPQSPDAGLYSKCRQDSDCGEGRHGHCEFSPYTAGTYCDYGCVVDADCGAGRVCLCGEPVGQCAEARCATDADCAAGQLCGDYVTSPGCGGIGFACQSAEDECAGPSDCSALSYEVCTLEGSSLGSPGGSRRVCSGPVCVIGRPFLIAGRECLASPLSRADWYSATANPATPELAMDASLRAELARSWTEQALMEHASVAAFARFSLQLLSLGAPPDLLLRSAQAMQDELGHARSCFELARHYSGSDVGPGPLPIDGALEESDLCSIVLGTLVEGCIGETVAALEAAEALAHCEDAKLRQVLERISREEGQHAELAWQFVAWALATGPSSLVERVREAFDAALSSPVSQPVQPSAFERELLRHGVVSVGLRNALRQRALGEVIAPCARALLEQARHQAPIRRSATIRKSRSRRSSGQV